MDLRALVEEECSRFGVPGAAVTVVRAGEVVLTHGFGVRNQAADPVTPTTLFMLASDTKCFAAATLCLLAEDGLLDLDQPVRDHLPWFAMHDDRISGWVTTRDLLAHRTGLPRHDFLTIGDGEWTISNEDVARRMRHLEGMRPFRQAFGYNNAHYATAGHVAEVLTGQPWRQFLAERLLTPTGMAGSGTYLPEQTSGDFAEPHVHGRPVPHQSRPYDLPSGGIVTHATDLGRWLLARLGEGPLSAEVLAMLHAPAIVGPALPFREIHAMGYALGNTVFSYRGHRLHCHGGNQVGFASQVIVLPDDHVGVAVLTNAHASQLPLALGLALVDRVLGLDPVPWGERLCAAPPPVSAPEAAADHKASRQLPDYQGAFNHPAYGELSFEVSDGLLRASFHGLDDQLILTHREGDCWVLGFARVPGITVPLCFSRGSDGTVTGVTARFDAELAPLPFART